MTRGTFTRVNIHNSHVIHHTTSPLLESKRGLIAVPVRERVMIGLPGDACGRGSVSSGSKGWSSVETSAVSLTGGISVRCDLFLLNWPIGVCTKYDIGMEAGAVTVPGT